MTATPILLMLIGIPGSGKALTLDTEIPTLNGFKFMSEITIEDILFDENGDPCTVKKITGIMRNRKCYRMTFSNGAVVNSDENHQWLTRDYQAAYSEKNFKAKEKKRINNGKLRKNDWRDQSIKRKFPRIVTTKEIFKTLKAENGKRLNHSILIPNPVKFKEIDLPIKPYTLGAWLGDGDSSNSSILEIFQNRVKILLYGRRQKMKP